MMLPVRYARRDSDSFRIISSLTYVSAEGFKNAMNLLNCA